MNTGSPVLFRRAGLLLAALVVLHLFLPRIALGAGPWDALPERIAVVQGGLVVLPVPTIAGLEARVFGRTVPVQAAGETNVVLIAASYHLQPDVYPLTLRAPGVTRTVQAEVVAREFPVQALVAAPAAEERVRPTSAAGRERQAQEARDVSESRQVSADLPLWEGPFIWPVTGRITGEFGLIRTVNGLPASRHSGLDIAAPEGTPVRAGNAGRVVLAADHLTEGKTVIIDHGWRVSTSYLHLSEILVRVGQRVEKGEVIGKVGSTGFATGPHLHWTANVDGVFVDPRFLIDGALDF